MDDPALPRVSNIPEYTVAEISGAVKKTLEGAFGRVRVRGEVTEVRPYPSGHIYFSLKEEKCKLACVAWASVVPRMGLRPENGVEVVATGRITGYGDRSSYQMSVERLEYAGIGALLARIEALRQKLAAEGIFDLSRKRVLPMLPLVVGVITSESGAVLHDIRTTIARRFPRRVLLWPVPVQGEGAAQKIAAAIAGFAALAADGPVPRPDVLIVARGGGSLEDLMAFNDEAVVRAAALCPIPLISAVGHETDTTLIDHVADRRAPTPTAAAEMAVPSRAELTVGIFRLGASLVSCGQAALRHHRVDLERAARGLPDLPGLLGLARQRTDDRGERLKLALPNLLARRRTALERAERQLPDPRSLLRQAGHALELSAARLRSALRHALAERASSAASIMARLSDAPLRARLREAHARLDAQVGRLESLSHRAVLARGYAAVFDAAGMPLTTAAAVPPGADLRIAFADGEVAARAAGKRPDTRQGVLL
jgi:exodeoxyribonuclease VII large subunit